MTRDTSVGLYFAEVNKSQIIYIIYYLSWRFHSLFTPSGASVAIIYTSIYKLPCLKGAFHLSLTVLVCYRSQLHIV